MNDILITDVTEHDLPGILALARHIVKSDVLFNPKTTTHINKFDIRKHNM